MMHTPDRDDEYIALLRERLPSDDDKERMRKRLAALGVGGGAALASAATQAQALPASTGFVSLGKVVAGLAGAVVLGSALYFAYLTVRQAPPAPVPAQAPVAEPSAPPSREPGPAQATPAEPRTSTPSEEASPRRPRSKKPGPLDTLSAENALLSAAVRAMHAGNTARAERLLREHELRYPNGVLREERERARKKLREAQAD